MKEFNFNDKLKKAYKNEKTAKYAQNLINQINEDLELREKGSIISNGIAYSKSYEINEKKAINYSPPRNEGDDRNVSFGLIHEKIVGFISIYLRYVFKRNIKVYDDNNNLIKRLGDVYDLGIEYSYLLEKLGKRIALIYWEVFTQGNAFILEDWQVRTINEVDAFNSAKDGEAVNPENMDYTYEFLDNLTYKKGKQIQKRMAVSTLLDGRKVIFGDPEVNEVQEQPRITIEEKLSKAGAEAMFGTLKRWDSIPKEKEDITTMVGDTLTLFDSSRNKKPEDQYIIHRVYDKENNKFNIFVNGIMMLPMDTPMSLFYPRMNYPLTNISAERVRGSIYARSIPAKTKFNDDYLNWMLKMLSNKFEQGVNPAILAHGKYTLTRDIFKGGQVTHGVKKEDFDKVDPDNKGVSSSEFSFVKMLKEIIDNQTLGATTAGQLSANATATEISTVQNNQMTKLAIMLDGLVNGFVDMALRRAETIESKYTIKQKETMVDNKTISVYQNFTVNVSGVENSIIFDDNVGTFGYDEETKSDELFTEAFKNKKEGNPTAKYLINPKILREGKLHIHLEVLPEIKKDSQLEMIKMWNEFTQLLNTFGRSSQGGTVDMKELEKEYLKESGRPDTLFTSEVYKQLEQQNQQQGGATNMGQLGTPTIKNAQQQQMGIKQ